MTEHKKRIELLAPAGNIEKLNIAFKFGADAIYCGGTKFGLRKYADNFSINELKEGIQIANNSNKKVYIVLNGFPHNEDMKELPHYLENLQKLQPHGLIISDLGLISEVKKQTDLTVHVSTQASITNWRACKLLKEAGAERIILAREVNIEECKEIKKHLDVELEVFVHGAQCASYSGKCVISNYTSGRDSNRGGCLQSCRHKYDIINPETKELEDSTFIMNAKDQMGIHLIPELIDSGMDSLKIEGRMKSNIYLANTVTNYRTTIDEYYQTKSSKSLPLKETELKKVSNRSFESGGLESRPLGHTIQYKFCHSQKFIEFIGTVKEAEPNKYIICEVKFPFKKNDTVELLHQNGDIQSIQITQLSTISDEPLEQAKTSSLIKLPWIKNTQKYDMIRLPINE